MEDADPNNLRYRLTREAGGATAWLRARWAQRWFRLLSYALGAALIGILLIWVLFARDMPSAEKLLSYEPPLPTMVRDIDGQPVHSYARERRVQLEYAEFPPLLVRAYLAAEDRTFFEHGGLDYPGIAKAILTNLTSSGRPVGASTITQQVAKNLLLTNELSYSRKIKEAILAYRIEQTLNKQQILELYLNEIYLGRNSYGVQAAAQAYFGKDVGQLALHEMAYLAILPKGPSNYQPERRYQRAIDRRNWALGEMLKNDWITQAQHDAAVAMPLSTIARTAGPFKRIAGYYMEEIRRQLIEQFGETAEDGPYSVYAGGLWVRSPVHPRYQRLTEKALRDGLLRYHAGKGWRGPIATIPMDDGKWAQRLASSNLGIDYANWRLGVALGGGQVGFANGTLGRLSSVPDGVKAGDVIAVAPMGGNMFALRIIPEVGGGMVVQNPHTGRLYAMQGGFDSRLSSFNRATQALRQPGSTIKPFVYATALDNGMTPASMIEDRTFCVWQSASLGQKCFRNFGGGGGGVHTMRWGLEQSRNLMTVRIAHEAGMPKVVRTFKAMGIGDYTPYLSFALGAGDTTVEKMVNAYSMLVNHGRKLEPKAIDFVQDRRGKVIWPKNWRACKYCNMADWDGKAMPRFRPNGRQLMDPVTAYQVVHMLEGVIQKGTARRLADLNRPLFGKTGTTSGPTNVWFIGGSPDLVAGVYLGYDQPRNLGGYAQGGSIAAPIFKQFAVEALKDFPVRPFTAPAETRMVRIERNSGKRVYGSWPDDSLTGNIIWEAFKAETEPRRTARKDELEEADKGKARAASATAGRSVTTSRGSAATSAQDNDFIANEGGIY